LGLKIYLREFSGGHQGPGAGPWRGLFLMKPIRQGPMWKGPLCQVCSEPTGI
jgi:hypothetical protein